jgi:hypothetical protein
MTPDMKRRFLAILIILTIGCSENNNQEPLPCGWTGSLEQIPWVAALIDTMRDADGHCYSCMSSIVMATYNEQTVIYVQPGDIICDTIFPQSLYNCEGEVAKSFNNTIEEYNEFTEQVTSRKVIYTCKDSK